MLGFNLAYPAGVAPGFDPAHPASNGIFFSGVATGKNFRNILTGGNSVNVGSPTAFNGAFGPMAASANFTNAGNDFAYPSTVWNTQTLAAILVCDSVSLAAVRTILATSETAGTGFRLTCSSAAVPIATANSVSITPSLPAMIAGVPYFYAMSVKLGATGTPWNAVLTNMGTGQVYNSTGTSTINPAGAAGPNFQINGTASANTALFGKIAAAMHNTNIMSMADLLRWAQDPWSFWYPDR